MSDAQVTVTMKALTFTQPWAWLICSGKKHYDTRSWRTPYRGPLAIHAAASVNPEARKFAFDRSIDLTLLPLGKVVAIATLFDCVGTTLLREKLSAEELDAGNYEDGRWAWELGNVHVLGNPVPAKGALGLWEWQGKLQRLNCIGSDTMSL